MYDNLVLSIDFSKIAVAAVLGQVQDGAERFIGAASRKCMAYEQNYHSTKGEFLALVFGIKKFETVLRHQPFVVYTDNKSVVNWQTMKDQSHTFQRWFSFLAEFHFHVEFRPGKLNINADSLSRLPSNESDLHPDEVVMHFGHELGREYLFEFSIDKLWGDGWWAEVQKAQTDEHCPIMKWIQTAYNEMDEGRPPPPPDPAQAETAWWQRELLSSTRPISEIISFEVSATAADITVAMYNGQVIVPPKMRSAIVWHVHRSLYHRGTDAICQTLQAGKWFWPKIRAFIAETLQECNHCRHKRHVESIRDIEYVRKTIHPVNHKIYMDVFHACKLSNKGFPMLSIMDSTSRFAKAVCLNNVSSAEVIRAFHIHWVANFGSPVEVYVDNATYFDSREFKDYARLEGFDIRHSAPHSHQSNSVERWHRTFIEMLRAALNSGDARPVNQDEWNDLALSIGTAYNSICHASTGLSPFELMHGRTNPLVLAKFCPEVAAGYTSHSQVLMARIAAQSRLIQEMTKKQVVAFEQAQKRYSGRPNSFKAGDWVYRLLPVAVTMSAGSYRYIGSAHFTCRNQLTRRKPK